VDKPAGCCGHGDWKVGVCVACLSRRPVEPWDLTDVAGRKSRQDRVGNVVLTCGKRIYPQVAGPHLGSQR
jgi:hypothetical protein